MAVDAGETTTITVTADMVQAGLAAYYEGAVTDGNAAQCVRDTLMIVYRAMRACEPVAPAYPWDQC